MGEMADLEMANRWVEMFRIENTLERLLTKGRELKWHTKNEGITQVKYMEVSHLQNCIRLLNRRIIIGQGKKVYNEIMIEIMENEIEARKHGLKKKEVPE